MSATLGAGRTFFGLATLLSGALQLATGAFVRLVPWLPEWLPAPASWARLFGVVLVMSGLAILAGRRVPTAATVVAGLLLAVLVFLYPPSFTANPLIDRPFLRGFMYTNPLKILALVGGAAILAARFSEGSGGRPWIEHGVGRWQKAAPVLLAVFLLVCGLQHFAYLPFVKDLVPAWIPPGQLFWTRLTGVALIAGGLGILVPRTSHLAAVMSGVMILLWVPLLHIPRALAGPGHANETAGVFEALALSGVAFLVAATRPR